MPQPREVTLYPTGLTRDDIDYLIKRGAPELAPTVRGPLVATDPEGNVVLAIAKYGAGLDTLRAAVRSYPAGNTLRSNGVRNLSRTFGYVSRNQILQRNVCRACSGATEASTQHLAIVNGASRLAALARQFVPDRFAADLDLVGEQVLPEWRMADSGPWTSGVVNFDSPLPYHYDRNNFDVFSSMVSFARSIAGGHLHCPGWQLQDGTPLVLPCNDGDVTMFNGQQVLHGVTPFEQLTPSSYRISAVYYAVRRMKECLPFTEEIAAGRASRSAREDHWKENQDAL